VKIKNQLIIKSQFMKQKSDRSFMFRAWGKATVLILAGLLLATNMWAQSATIRGTVKGEDGESLPGVSVVVKGTTIGTITDVEGNYLLTGNIDSNGVIVFSFIGMKTVEVPVNSRTAIDATMQFEVLDLNEVVVVGYGTQQKKDVTGAVAMIKSDEFQSRPNTQMGSLIQGKAAGVQVYSNSGKPSQGFKVLIRGVNSINAGSDPLYVIDGIPTTDTRSVNPSDIENVTILKDASSCAIYGAQGANGVVIITTKKGSTEKTKVQLDVYNGFSQVWKTLDVLNGEQYRDLMTEMGQNTDWDKYNENTDWQNEIFQNGMSQSYQLSMSGNSKKTNYYVSAGWVQQVGAVRSAEMDRANFKVNLDQGVTDWLTVGTRVSYAKYSDVDVLDNQAVNQGGVLLGALTTPSVIGVYNEDGTFTSNPFQNWENPLAKTDGLDREYNSNRFLGNLYAKFTILKDFSFKTSLSVDYGNDIYDEFLDTFRTSYGIALKGRAYNSTGRSSYYQFENTLAYNKKLDKHNLELLAGQVSQEFFTESSSLERRNFPSANIQTPNAGSELFSATATKSQKRNSSFLGRVNYAFADKYLVTANFRMDGSSAFGPDNRWGFFPSFSAGWRISEESFLQNVEIINDLKLRAGWGMVGNDQITSVSNYPWYGKVGSGANYPIGGTVMPGTYPSSIQNEALKWEESEQTNVGVDLTMLQNRLRFSVEAYQKKTYDLLLNAPLPRSTGYDRAIQNVGELENKGLEFDLSGDILKGSAVEWTSSFNLSFNRNKVVDIVGQTISLGSIAGRGDAILIQEGHSLGELYGYVFAGVDPQTGNAYYLNSAGEPTFTPSADDRRVIGNSNPDFIYGFTNDISYKGFTLTIFLQGLSGNDMLNATRIDTEGMTDPKNQATAVLKRWRNPGDITDIPRASWGDATNSRISTRFIEDGSYMRIKTLSLSYQLPVSFVSKLKISNARIYATGENLFTFTNYSGFDPEVNAFSSNTETGIDYGTYPQTRNVIFGLSVTF